MNEPFPAPAPDTPIVWMLLPPSIVDQLGPKDGLKALILSPNLTGPVLRLLADRSPHSLGLWQTHREIIDHLESGARGWGTWPTDSRDLLAIGVLLGLWVKNQTDQLILELPEEEMEAIEEQCREEGKSFEQYLIDRIVEDKEDEDTL